MSTIKTRLPIVNDEAGGTVVVCTGFPTCSVGDTVTVDLETRYKQKRIYQLMVADVKTFQSIEAPDFVLQALSVDSGEKLQEVLTSAFKSYMPKSVQLTAYRLTFPLNFEKYKEILTGMNTVPGEPVGPNVIPIDLTVEDEDPFDSLFTDGPIDTQELSIDAADCDTWNYDHLYDDDHDDDLYDDDHDDRDLDYGYDYDDRELDD